jgi:hypothetical protein
MKKQFYSHIINIESLVAHLETLTLSDAEKAELLSIIDSHIHHTILDLILSELSEEEKKVFLMHMTDEQHDKVWELINNKVDNIEDKIKNAVDDVKTELQKDIDEVK